MLVCVDRKQMKVTVFVKWQIFFDLSIVLGHIELSVINFLPFIIYFWKEIFNFQLLVKCIVGLDLLLAGLVLQSDFFFFISKIYFLDFWLKALTSSPDQLNVPDLSWGNSCKLCVHWGAELAGSYPPLFPSPEVCLCDDCVSQHSLEFPATPSAEKFIKNHAVWYYYTLYNFCQIFHEILLLK